MKKINSIFWAFIIVLISHTTFGQCPYIQEVRLWDNSWNNPSGQSPNNYADYTNNCIPLFATTFTQINVTASQGNVYMAMYADLDNNGTFETQIFNFLDANGSTGVNPTTLVQPGTPIRVIVSASPITSSAAIPICGEVEDYVICGGQDPCDSCINFFGIVPLIANGCDYQFVMDYQAGNCGAISIISENWNFGHPGGTGTGTLVNHTFPGNGTYTVTATIQFMVTATGQICTSTQTLNVTVTGCTNCENCINFFGIVPLTANGCDYEFVMDYQAGNCGAISIVSETWDFGHPGGTGTGYYTTHTFPGNGTYTVTATIVYTVLATGQTCTSTQTLNVTVTGCTNCENCINFFGIVPLSANGCDYEFVMDYQAGNCGAISIVSETWDFGHPGGTGSGYYTTHTFPGNGTYTVTGTIVYTVLATGQTCTSTQTLNVTVTGCSSCEDCFNFLGIAILNAKACDYEFVMDYAASGNCGAIAILSEDWDFGYPGGTGTGTTTTHSFPGNGTYTVTATIQFMIVATGEICTSVQTLDIKVEDCINCADCFNFVGIAILDSKQCNYTFVMDYAATGNCGEIAIISEDWDFGYPGGTGTGTVANHTFPANGTYTVTATIQYMITATGQICTSTQTLNVTVTDCGDCPECFNFYGIEILDSKECKYAFLMNYAASGNCGAISIISENWDFGHPGGTGTGTTVGHTFPGNGVYTVTATVQYMVLNTGQICTSVQTLTVYVNGCNDCACVNGGEIQLFDAGNCAMGFWLGGFGIDGCATLVPQYTWNFGDNSSAVTSTNFTQHTYAAPGTYSVTVSFMVVDNVTGAICVQTYVTAVTIKDCDIIKSLNAETQPNEADEVTVYPNPSNDFVTFSIENGSAVSETDEKPELVLYDQMGREVYRGAFEGTQQVIDVRTFGSGMYLYRIAQHGQLIGTGELIVE